MLEVRSTAESNSFKWDTVAVLALSSSSLRRRARNIITPNTAQQNTVPSNAATTPTTTDVSSDSTASRAIVSVARSAVIDVVSLAVAVPVVWVLTRGAVFCFVNVIKDGEGVLGLVVAVAETVLWLFASLLEADNDEGDIDADIVVSVGPGVGFGVVGREDVVVNVEPGVGLGVGG